MKYINLFCRWGEKMLEKIRVLFYYKYVLIENVEEYVVKYLEFCKFIGFKGCILIVDEGINGIVFGDYEII